MASCVNVCSVFENHSRTRLAVFKDNALSTINNQRGVPKEHEVDETSEENLKKSIKMGSNVKIVLRQCGLQMEHNKNTLLQLGMKPAKAISCSL